MPSYEGNNILLTAHLLALYSVAKNNFIQKEQTIPIS